MAVEQKKRTLPPKVAAMKARKRQKLDAERSGGVPSDGRRKRVVDVNALAWKEISLPDRLDDYEGFFGLEEIDDVEVVRDESSGIISFQTKSEPGSSTKPEPLETAEREESPEWSGFDDETFPTEPSTDSEPQTKVKGNPKDQPATSTKPKAKSANSQDRNPAMAVGAFASLSENQDGEETDVSSWQDLKLSPDSLASLSKLKFSAPTAIQKAVIPEILAGHDVIGKASTGSGKTLAFGIPILERFLETRTRHGERLAKAAPLALVLSPTRELAHQLDKHISAVCSGLLYARPVIATLTGGLSVQKQQRLLRDADIVIGTPGRLWEVISQGQGVGALLKQIDFLVIDEADRLLSEGHFKEVEDILNSLDRVDKDKTGEIEEADEDTNPADSTVPQRQTLVFSATFDRGLQKKLVGKSHRRDNLLSNKESLEYLLAKLNFREDTPKFIDVNPVQQLAAGLREGLVECGAAEKDLYLYALLLLHANLRTLVFTNSIAAVRRLTPLLQNLGLPVLALHSGMPQKARLRSVERFSQAAGPGAKLAGSTKPPSSASSSVLIATDVAARGLDIANVQLVVHYHLPRAADMYVHRSGRTARAGQKGASVLICAPEEVAGVRKLVAQVHARSAAAASDGEKGAPAVGKRGYFMRTLDIDRRVVARLKERVGLAKTLADAVIAKEKQHKEDDFMRAAAEELGVEYDSEEFETQGPGKRGRGSGRKQKEREARQLGKAEAGALRAELRELLKQRVNVGVSERYLTSGRVDVDELLRQQDKGNGKTGEFLGTVGDLGLGDV